MNSVNLNFRFRVTRASKLKEDFTDTILGSNLNDNSWHHVKVLRVGRITEIRLDNITKTVLAPVLYEMLSFRKIFYMGGYEQLKLNHIRHLSFGTRFTGCLKIKEMDNRDPVLYFQKGNSRVQVIPTGVLSFGCPVVESKPVELTQPNSRIDITLNPNETRSVLEFSLSLRTFTRNGIVLQLKDKKCLLKLYLQDAKFVVDLRNSGQNSLEGRLDSDKAISDGMWHIITMIISSTDILLKVNGASRTSLTIPETSISCTQPYLLQVGGLNFVDQKGFVGCVKNLQFNEQKLTFSTKDSNTKYENGVRYGCNLSDRCYPSPCRNKGRCLQTWKARTCDCSGTNFYGKTCDTYIYKASCAAYQTIGLKETSYCLIDSDGRGDRKPYTTLCNFNKNKEAYTTVHHNKENEFSAKNSEIKFQKYSFHKLKYEMELSKITALIKRSKYCRQKVKFRCYNALLMNAPNGPPNVGWRSVNRELKSHWGGVPENGKGCACGLNNTCIKSDKLCNCDYRNNAWAEDSGYLTDKHNLPVTRLDITDITDGYAFLQIGPLECYGDNSPNEDDNDSSESYFPKDILSQVCITTQNKANLVNNANSTKRGIIQIESEPQTTETPEAIGQEIKIKPNDSNGDDGVLTSPSSKRETTKGLTILEIGLISVAGLAVIVLVVKFIVCTMCNKLHGEVLLNQDIAKGDNEIIQQFQPNGNPPSKKPKKKGILRAYWV